jgi:hypothetical protein
MTKSRKSSSVRARQASISSAKKCYLLTTTPPEIRESILKYLIQPETKHFCMSPAHHHPLLPVSCSTKALVTLTRVCKQLYFETVAIYYSGSAFKFDSTNSRKVAPFSRLTSYLLTLFIVRNFLKGVGPGRRQHIKDVTFTLREVKGDRTIPNQATTLLGQCHRLKKLKVILEYDSVLTWYNHNLLRTAGMKKLRKIRGCEEVNVEQAPLDPWVVRRGYETTFTEEEVERFKEVLRGELCREKEAAVEVVKEIVIEEEED